MQGGTLMYIMSQWATLCWWRLTPILPHQTLLGRKISKTYLSSITITQKTMALSPMAFTIRPILAKFKLWFHYRTHNISDSDKEQDSYSREDDLVKDPLFHAQECCWDWWWIPPACISGPLHYPKFLLSCFPFGYNKGVHMHDAIQMNLEGVALALKRDSSTEFATQRWFSQLRPQDPLLP